MAFLLGFSVLYWAVAVLLALWALIFGPVGVLGGAAMIYIVVLVRVWSRR